MAFDWQKATLDQTVEHVLNSSYAAVSRARKYYVDKLSIDVVEKIDSARKIAVVKRMESKLESLR